MPQTIGNLYIIATPIGNKQDITYRAIEQLKQVDLIAAEDKRHSRPLLEHYQINTPMITLHDHNERDLITQITNKLSDGQNIALISDAGTPLISDPGYLLVQACREKGFTVIPIPGPSAIICALSAAGLPTDRFTYEGFPPRTQSARLVSFEKLADQTATIIFYEASHRIEQSLADMATIFGTDRQAVIARELTKTFETFLSGSLSQLSSMLKEDSNQTRGEFVVMLRGKKTTETLSSESQQVLKLLIKELPTKKAAAITAKITGDKKNQLYQFALSMKEPKV